MSDVVLSPIHISQLMDLATAHPGRAAAMTEAVAWRLLKCGLIQMTSGGGAGKSPFALTAKGDAYVEALTEVPLPVQKWVCQYAEER